MNPTRIHCEDWIIRAKRGGLSIDEERQFRELLATSLEARLLYRAGCAFDREGGVESGDEARIARMVRGVDAAYPRSSGRVRQRFVALSVGAAVSMVAIAAAALSVPAVLRKVTANRALLQQPAHALEHLGSRPMALRTHWTSRISATQRPLAEPSHDAERARLDTPELAAQKSTVEGGSSAQPQPVAERDSSSLLEPDVERDSFPRTQSVARFVDEPDQAASRPLRGTADAASLFASANGARVRGDPSTAITEYERLIESYPSAREAMAARLSLGMLYFRQGRPERALGQFRSYASARGGHATDALWGEAQALRALQRWTEERAVLTRIVQEHPDCAYASAARSRLAQQERQ